MRRLDICIINLLSDLIFDFRSDIMVKGPRCINLHSFKTQHKGMTIMINPQMKIAKLKITLIGSEPFLVYTKYSKIAERLSEFGSLLNSSCDIFRSLPQANFNSL